MLITEKRMRGGITFSTGFFSEKEESMNSPLAAAPDLRKSLRRGMVLFFAVNEKFFLMSCGF
jgi:hypothetical protein